MSSVSLVFRSAPLTGSPVGLVFGNTADNPEQIDAAIGAALPALTLAAIATAAVDAVFVATLPGLSLVALGGYVSNCERPLVGKTAAWHQVAQRAENGPEHRSRDAGRASASKRMPWARAVDLAGLLRVDMPHTFVGVRRSLDSRFAEAAHLPVAQRDFRSQETLHDRRMSREARFSEAIDVRTITGSAYADMLRDRRPSVVQAYQEAIALYASFFASAQIARPATKGWAEFWRKAIRPLPGTTLVVIPPGPTDEPCYIPDPNLLFAEAWTADTNLVFVCERVVEPPVATTVIPIQRVYMVVNNCTLRRVSDNAVIPTLTMGLSIDFESWTWGFTASVPAMAQAFVESSSGDPVELEAVINGTSYRVLAESISRERTFGRASLRVQGRGRAAALDAPYAPSSTFGNDAARTAQQLMADVLTVNGVSLGWSVDWGLTDWLVPAGAWSHQGSYISALNAIAAAAGGYLQPHATAQTIRVLPRYPVAPWDWGTATPDVEIPASIATREGIAWIKRPEYNRVFVSGQQSGLLGQVTRTGTAGDLLAPMVTDALMTHADAIRQRGVAILGDTGRQAQVSLRMPVVADYGGVIGPGKLVRYVDGSEVRFGIVRSTSVDVGGAEVWQTIGVETHVA